MRAALLSTRVEIQGKAKATDKLGATVTQWQPLFKVWADIRHTSGKETIKADALTSIVRASVRIRRRKDVTAQMRVVLGDGSIYDIKAIQPDLQSREFIDLICERVDKC